MNVFDATLKRLEYIFEEFDKVYFSFSGGKDSGLMVQLANLVAEKLDRNFDLLILNIEANYTATVDFIKKIEQLPRVQNIYHFCLPFFEDNNTSFFQPQWKMWDPSEKEKWIHSLPKNAITLENIDDGLKKYYSLSNGNPDRFLRYFQNWYKEQYPQSAISCGVGIRAQESLHRHSAVTKGENKYKNRCWINITLEGNILFYPLFDWKVGDIWAATFKCELEYNYIYEKMYKIGYKYRDMRVCQPFGLQQRKALNQFAELEPETWDKLVKRVSGVNFGNIYGKTSLLGLNTSQKPSFMTWQRYSIFLLETLGLYSPLLMNHYYRKICILFAYYKNTYNMDIQDMPDESKRKDWIKDERLWNDWKGIAKALEKNDFVLSTRNYSLTKKDEAELYEMFKEYKDFLGINQLKGKKYENIVQKIGGMK